MGRITFADIDCYPVRWNFKTISSIIFQILIRQNSGMFKTPSEFRNFQNTPDFIMFKQEICVETFDLKILVVLIKTGALKARVFALCMLGISDFSSVEIFDL